MPGGLAARPEGLSCSASSARSAIKPKLSLLYLTPKIQQWHGGRLSTVSAGERKLHATVPFLAGAGCLALLGAYVDHNPAAAFAALLGATVLWGPAGIIYGLPAMFLQARGPPALFLP